MASRWHCNSLITGTFDHPLTSSWKGKFSSGRSRGWRMCKRSSTSITIRAGISRKLYVRSVTRLTTMWVMIVRAILKRVKST